MAPKKTTAISNTLERPPLWPQPIPVIGLTGEYASGKTLFGLTIAPGPDTLVYDTEKSAVSYEAIGFERVDVPAEMTRRYPRGGHRPIDTFVWWRDHIRAIPVGKYRVIVLDTASEIESGLSDYVAAHPAEFGRTSAQYAKMSALIWGDVKEHWKLLLSDIASKCDTFVFTVHLKPIWVGNQATTKKTPKGKSTLEELASLYLWMRRDKDGKGNVPAIPAAEVRKSRLAHTTLDPVTGEVRIVPALPPRLPIATPAAIREYQRTPPDYARLKAEERAPEERLTDDERAELRTRAAEAEAEAARLELEKLDRQEASRVKRVAASARTVEQEAPAEQPAEQPAKPTRVTPSGKPKAVEYATQEQLATLADLRDHLFEATAEEHPREKWAAILSKRAVTSAAQLTPVQADELAMRLRHQISALQLEEAMDRPSNLPAEDSPTGEDGGD